MLFADLSDDDLACFVRAAQARSYPKGKILYLQGEEATHFYIICSGWIKLFHTTQEGEEVIVDMLTCGYMVGEGAIFEQSHHTSSAEVIEDVLLLSIPASVLKDQIGQSPTLARNMLSSMSRQHRRHYDTMAVNVTQSAPERIGGFLLRLCVVDEKKSAVLYLPYDKTLIATTLGMKGATFSRALNVLREKAGVHVRGDRVEINSVEQLAKFVYGPLAPKYASEDM